MHIHILIYMKMSITIYSNNIKLICDISMM